MAVATGLDGHTGLRAVCADCPVTADTVSGLKPQNVASWCGGCCLPGEVLRAKGLGEGGRIADPRSPEGPGGLWGWWGVWASRETRFPGSIPGARY